MEEVEATADETSAADARADATAARSPHVGGLIVTAFAVLAAVPVVVALVALRHPHWYPAGDMAQAELHVRGLWDHPPLVGAAGRLGTLQDQGSHPGPALWLAMYPVYALFGRSSYGLLAGAASVHLVAIALALWVAWRRAGLTFTIVLGVAIAVVVRASGPAFFVEPWNPWLAVFAFLLFLLLLWDVLEGQRSRLPLAVLAGTYCIHCHVGYLPIAGTLVVGVVAWTAWTLHREGVRVLRALARPLTWSAVVLVVMWLPPVIDQLIHDPGNLLILWRNFRYPTEPAVGLVHAVKGFAGEVNVVGPWIVGRGHLPTDPPNVLGFVALMALWLGSALVAIRRRYRDLVHLHALLAGTCAIGILAIARITGTVFDYLLRWLWIVAALIVTASVTTLVRWWADSRAPVTERGSKRGWKVAFIGLGVAVVVTVAAVPKFADAELPGPRDSVIIGDLVRGARGQLVKDDRYLVRWTDPTALGATGFGTLLELARQGYHVGVDRPQRAGALPFRVLDEADADGVLSVVIGKDIDRWRARTDAVELASAEPRTPAEQVEGEALREHLIARLQEIGRADLVPTLDTLYAAVLFAPDMPDDVKRDMSRLTDLRLPGALFLTAPGAPSEPPPA